MELEKLGKKAKTINIDQIALKNAKANSGLISDLNRQQLTVGENSKGQDVGQYTTARYASFKKRIGSQAPVGVPDLKVSGNLYEKIFTEVSPQTITINTKAEYGKYNEKRYGKEIFNLQDQNWEEIEFKVLVATREQYLKQLGL